MLAVLRNNKLGRLAVFVKSPWEPGANLRSMASGKLAERFHQRLFSRLSKGDQARVAGFAGLSPSTISRWRNRADPINPRFETVERIAEAIGVDATWLLGADEPEVPRVTEALPGSYGEPAFVTVPLLKDRVAAGIPQAVDQTEVITRLPFTRYWVRKRLGTVPREGRLVLIRVEEGWLGDSMLPTIVPGSMLLIDRGPRGEGLTEIKDNKVYLLATEDGLTVKRVHRVGEHLIATPDNHSEEHRPFVVELRGRRIQDIVKGRVIWVACQDI